LGYRDTYQGNILNNIQAAALAPLVNIVNMGAHAQPQPAVPNPFIPAPPNGDICVNIYAFSQAGALQTCCSCRLAANAALVLNGPNLGPTVVGANYSILKLVASLPLNSTSTCDATAQPSPTAGAPGGFAAGMIGWTTHLPFFFPSDTEFRPAPLGGGEITRLVTLCKALPVASRCACNVPQ